ncbi:MAG: hypothetical protein JOY82_20380 [Streptosporangiaceae bacterium]|nr:hypothetical protein [Streptosporangiaceae bacterium]MBV9856843.1 hypothetical protein [Streptosporangiaceae bacterium]
MIAAVAGYMIRGGKPDDDRLALLARERCPIPEPCWSWPEYHRHACIDIGCGGAVTVEVAPLAAPGGTLVGTGTDQGKIQRGSAGGRARRRQRRVPGS